jgi:hypothetical protein
VRQEHVRWRSVDERHRLAVETGLPHHKARGNLQACPSLTQDVYRQQRATGHRICLNAQVVVDARQRRVDRRIGDGRRRWIGAVAQGAVLVDGKDDPAIRRRRRLRERDSSIQTRTHECNGKDEACSVHAILLPVSTPGRGSWLRVMTRQNRRAPGPDGLQVSDRRPTEGNRR